MRRRVEREKLRTPDVFEVMGETVVREYREHRFFECRVCGWVIDL